MVCKRSSFGKNGRDGTYLHTYAHNLIWGPHFRVLRHWSLRDQRRTATTSCERHQSKVTLWNIYIHTHMHTVLYIHTYIHKWTSCMAFKLWNTVELVILLGPRSSLLFQEFPSISNSRSSSNGTSDVFEIRK